MANKKLIFLACNIYSILAEYSLHSCTFRWALWQMGLWFGKGQGSGSLIIGAVNLQRKSYCFRAPAAQRQMRKKISFGPTFFHLAQTFGAYFFRRHFYFFLCYKWYELRKRLLTPNKQCRWRVFLNWWWPLVIIGYKVRPIIDTYLVDWTWCFI